MELVNAVFGPESYIEPYYIELSVDDIRDPDEQLYLNKIPTSFYLEKEQIDHLIGTAKNLLNQDEDYQRLIKKLGAQVTAGNTTPLSQ